RRHAGVHGPARARRDDVCPHARFQLSGRAVGRPQRGGGAQAGPEGAVPGPGAAPGAALQRQRRADLHRLQSQPVTDYSHIGVVGGGAWGTALASLARRAGRRVSLWSRDPSISQAIAAKRANPIYLPGVALEAGIEAARDLGDLASGDALLLVSPAQAVRALAPRLPGTSPIVICAKGIEASTGLLMPELMAELLPARPLAMLSGPSFAEE